MASTLILHLLAALRVCKSCKQKLMSWICGLGTPYSPPSPPDTSSSATMSPVYPDRPIRPLPKRSLRERLSPEVADQIAYPIVPTSESVFNVQYAGTPVQRGANGVAGSLQEIDRYDRALIEAQEDYDDTCQDVPVPFS